MRTIRQYSQELKNSMVRKMMIPGGPSASALSKEVGISQPVLSRWARKYGRTLGMKDEQRRPEQWTYEEKVKVVLESAELSEEERGVYLRRKGIHQTHLEQWKAEIVEGMKSLDNPVDHRKEHNRKIKELERELRRKEKALAEAAALLVLKKKAEMMWGDHEDDELESK